MLERVHNTILITIASDFRQWLPVIAEHIFIDSIERGFIDMEILRTKLKSIKVQLLEHTITAILP